MTTTDTGLTHDQAKIITHLERGIVTLHEAVIELSRTGGHPAYWRQLLVDDFSEFVAPATITTRGIPVEMRLKVACGLHIEITYGGLGETFEKFDMTGLRITEDKFGRYILAVHDDSANVHITFD